MNIKKNENKKYIYKKKKIKKKRERKERTERNGKIMGRRRQRRDGEWFEIMGVDEIMERQRQKEGWEVVELLK